MQLKHVEYFVETSKYKSFNEAAKIFLSRNHHSAPPSLRWKKNWDSNFSIALNMALSFQRPEV